MKASFLKDKYDKLELPVKASIWFLICNVLLKGIGLITVPIFTRMMPDDQYGLLSVYMAYQEIILTLSTWEIALSAYQKGLFKYKGNLQKFTISTQLFSTLITSAFFALLFLFFRPFSHFSGMSAWSAVLLYVFMILHPAYSCWLVEKKTSYDYKHAVAVTLLYSVANVAVPMIALVTIGRTAEIKFNASLIGSAVVFVYFYIRNAEYWQLAGEKHMVKQQWKFIVVYQLPIVFHALSYTVLSHSDRIMIGRLVGDTKAAYYSVAYSLGSAVSLFQSALSQTLVPWRFEKLEQKRYGDIRSVTDYLLLGIGALVILFVLAAPEAMVLLFSDSYYEAVWSIPPVALSVFYMFIFTMFVWVENYYEKTLYVGVISAVCALINILLNYTLIGVFGYIVCGYTTVISYIFCGIFHYFAMKKVCRECGVKERIYNVHNIVVISMILSVCVIITTVLYPYPLMRYLIFVVLIVGGIILWRHIGLSLSEKK